GFFALTGCFPFEAELASAVLIAHVNKPAPTVRSINPTVPGQLASIIDRCLAKDPSRRYANAAELLAALDAAIVTLSGPKGPVDGRPRLVSDTEAHRVWQRASELQASTGAQPRPAPVAKPRDESRDRSRSTGFRVDEIRDAGREAGIS